MLRASMCIIYMYFTIFIIKSNMQFELQVHHLFLNTEEFIVSKAYAIYRKLHKITQELKIPQKSKTIRLHLSFYLKTLFKCSLNLVQNGT